MLAAHTPKKVAARRTKPRAAHLNANVLFVSTDWTGGRGDFNPAHSHWPLTLL